MPFLCDAIRLRSCPIFPIDLILKCVLTIDVGVEYYHAWTAIDLMTERCIELVGDEYIPRLEAAICKLTKHVKEMVTNFPNLIVDIDTTLPRKNDEMDTFREKIIAEQYTLLKTSMEQSHEKKLLDIFKFILNFLNKLVHISSDVEESEESEKMQQNKLFNDRTQIRIKLAETDVTRYSNFVDEEAVKQLFVNYLDVVGGVNSQNIE